MSTTLASAPSAPSPDRSVRLMVLGGFQILLGCFSAFLAVMMGALFLGGRVPQSPQGPPFNARMMIPGVGMYLLIAVAFIWVGIGMLRTRRWAWALTLVISWMGLILGILGSVMMQVVMGPKYWAAIVDQGHLPPEMLRVMWATTTLMTIGLYVFLPGLFVVLCQPKSVRDTCYRLDPRPRWTDRCPLAVLAICIFHAFAVIGMFSLAPYNWTLPVFGSMLTGPTGALVICVIAIVLACLAWGTYRLNMLAWWSTLVLALVGTANSVVMLRQGDILSMYEKMGFPAETVDMIRKMGMIEMFASYGVWANIAIAVAYVGYLLYVRRYFVRKPEIAGATP